MKPPKLGQGMSGAASRYVATRSVLNPMLWLSGIVTPAAFAATWFAPAELTLQLFYFGIAPPTVAILGFIFFALRDANRLQSEEFVLQQQWVSAQIGDNRTKEVIDVPIEASALTTNSAMIQGHEA